MLQKVLLLLLHGHLCPADETAWLLDQGMLLLASCSLAVPSDRVRSAVSAVDASLLAVDLWLLTWHLCCTHHFCEYVQGGRRAGIPAGAALLLASAKLCCSGQRHNESCSTPAPGCPPACCTGIACCSQDSHPKLIWCLSLEHGRSLNLGFASTMQVEVHPHFRNERLRQWCTEQNIHVTAYGPLSSPGTMLSMGKSLPNLMRVSMLGRNDAGLTCQLLDCSSEPPASALVECLQ